MRALLAVLVLAAQAAGAAERAPAQFTRNRATSQLKEISTKPLYLYSDRGRRDPFVKVTDVGPEASAKLDKEFSVTELTLVGFLDLGGAPVAMFRHRLGSTTYTLKGGKLYSPSNQPVANVSGRLESDRRVLLTQGEKRMIFRPFSSQRR